MGKFYIAVSKKQIFVSSMNNRETKCRGWMLSLWKIWIADFFKLAAVISPSSYVILLRIIHNSFKFDPMFLSGHQIIQNETAKKL